MERLERLERHSWLERFEPSELALPDGGSYACFIRALDLIGKYAEAFLSSDPG